MICIAGASGGMFCEYCCSDNTNTTTTTSTNNTRIFCNKPQHLSFVIGTSVVIVVACLRMDDDDLCCCGSSSFSFLRLTTCSHMVDTL